MRGPGVEDVRVVVNFEIPCSGETVIVLILGNVVAGFVAGRSSTRRLLIT